LRRAGVRVLGHLQVAVDGLSVAVPRGLPARLCVILAVERHAPVSDDVLLDRLWGESPPASALASLRNTAGRLRAILGTGAIRRDGDGYRLDPEVVLTDLEQFECLTARARRPGTQRDDARRLLDEALDLVRGTPLVEVASEPWAASVVSYWEEQIASAADDSATLAAGAADHAAVPVLRRLAHQRPEREIRWVRLMELLSRTGRRTEALRTFREARAALAEFGVEPGPDLRQTERAIVLDEAPSTPPDGPARPAGGAPFVDREHELAELSTALTTTRVITITGLGGVGKTRLARELMVREAPRFPGGAVFADLSPVSDPALAPAAVAAAAGIRRSAPTADGDEIGRLVEILRAEPGLVVLDNAEHVADAVASLAARLALAAPASRVVVTSRVPLSFEGEEVFRLGPLPVPPDDADDAETGSSPSVQLLLRLVGGTPEENGADAARIVRQVAGLPLGIELCGRLASVLSMSEVARGLGDRARLLGLGAGAQSVPLRGIFDWILERADPGDVAVFARLSAFRGPFTLRSAEHVVDRADLTAPVVASLCHLVEASLVHRDGGSPTAYRLDPVQSCYAAELAARHDEPDALDGTLAAWYRTLAVELMPALRAEGQRDAIAVLHVEMGNYRDLISRLLAAGRGDDALTIAAALGDYWFFTGYWVEGSTLIEAALAAAGDEAGLGRAIGVVQRARACGTYAGVSGSYADLRSAIDVATEHGRPDLAREAQAWLGLASGRAGRYEECWTELSAVVADTAHPWPGAHARMFLGMGAVMLGQADYGRSECHRAADTFRELGDELNAANVLKNAGLMLHRHGERIAARDDLAAALESAGDVMPVLSAHARYALAMIDLEAGHDTGVEEQVDAIRSDLRRVGDLSHLSACHRALAALHVARGDQAAALELLREAVPGLVGHDEQELGLVLLDIADRYVALGHDRDLPALAAATALLATGTGYAWDAGQYARLAGLTDRIGGRPEIGGDRERVIAAGVGAALECAGGVNPVRRWSRPSAISR
jgi:predicted ATPase/DNA-binding SARP family transcriptional activator